MNQQAVGQSSSVSSTSKDSMRPDSAPVGYYSGSGNDESSVATRPEQPRISETPTAAGPQNPQPTLRVMLPAGSGIDYKNLSADTPVAGSTLGGGALGRNSSFATAFGDALSLKSPRTQEFTPTVASSSMAEGASMMEQQSRTSATAATTSNRTAASAPVLALESNSDPQLSRKMMSMGVGAVRVQGQEQGQGAPSQQQPQQVLQKSGSGSSLLDVYPQLLLHPKTALQSIPTESSQLWGASKSTGAGSLAGAGAGSQHQKPIQAVLKAEKPGAERPTQDRVQGQEQEHLHVERSSVTRVACSAGGGGSGVTTAASSDMSGGGSVNSSSSDTASTLDNASVCSSRSATTSPASSDVPEGEHGVSIYHSTLSCAAAAKELHKQTRPAVSSGHGASKQQQQPQVQPAPVKTEGATTATGASGNNSGAPCAPAAGTEAPLNREVDADTAAAIRMRRRGGRGAAFMLNTPVLVPALNVDGVITEEKNGGWKYVSFSRPVTTDASIIGKTVAAAAMKQHSAGEGGGVSLGPQQVIIHGKWCRACDICEVGTDLTSLTQQLGGAGSTAQGGSGGMMTLIHKNRPSNSINMGLYLQGSGSGGRGRKGRNETSVAVTRGAGRAKNASGVSHGRGGGESGAGSRGGGVATLKMNRLKAGAAGAEVGAGGYVYSGQRASNDFSDAFSHSQSELLDNGGGGGSGYPGDDDFLPQSDGEDDGYDGGSGEGDDGSVGGLGYDSDCAGDAPDIDVDTLRQYLGMSPLPTEEGACMQQEQEQQGNGPHLQQGQSQPLMVDTTASGHSLVYSFGGGQLQQGAPLSSSAPTASCPIDFVDTLWGSYGGFGSDQQQGQGQGQLQGVNQTQTPQKLRISPPQHNHSQLNQFSYQQQSPWSRPRSLTCVEPSRAAAATSLGLGPTGGFPGSGDGDGSSSNQGKRRRSSMDLGSGGRQDTATSGLFDAEFKQSISAKIAVASSRGSSSSNNNNNNNSGSCPTSLPSGGGSVSRKQSGDGNNITGMRRPRANSNDLTNINTSSSSSISSSSSGSSGCSASQLPSGGQREAQDPTAGPGTTQAHARTQTQAQEDADLLNVFLRDLED